MKCCRLPAMAFSMVVVLGGMTARGGLIIPTDDNNVLKSAADTPQPNGATFTLKVASTSQSNARIGFLKFDLTDYPSITDPVTFTATISGATTADFTLQLYGLLASDPAPTGYDWTESLLTYNNRPAPNNTSGVLVDTALTPRLASDQTVTILSGSPAGTSASFTFNGLEGLRQSDDTATLILLVSSQSSNTPSLGINSSEATSGKPTLAINAPEPASIGLLVVGAAGMLARRRRMQIARTAE
jgi:hypothetical protein